MEPRSMRRRLLETGINGAFSVAPAGLVTWRHERNHRSRLGTLLDAEPLFLHIPKSGGQSIQEALGQEKTGHFTYSRLVREDPAVADKSEFFAVLRDPVARMISTYFYIRRVHQQAGTSTLPRAAAAPSLDAFLVEVLPRLSVTRHYFLRPASQYIAGVALDRLTLLNFDRLPEAFAAYSLIHMDGQIELPHVNATPRNPVKISREARTTVEQLYSRDVAMWRALGAAPSARVGSLHT